LARFVDEIKFFDVHIIYRPGPEQMAADALSRKPDDESDTLNPPKEVADSLFIIESVVERSFKKLNHLKENHPEELARKGFVVDGEDLYQTIKGQKVRIITKLIEAKKITFETHVRLGHRNAKDTLCQLKHECYFPCMQKVVEKITQECVSCQFCGNNTNKNRMPLQVIERKGPFVTWGMDFVGPLPISSNGNQYLVTAIDYCTGWAYAVPLKARTGLVAAKLVKEIIENHGFPHSITTDNGTEFKSKVFQEFLSGNHIIHSRISPYHPQSNGLVERFHSTLINSLQKMCVPDKQSDWDQYTGLALLGYRTSRTSRLERSPFYMCYGMEPSLAIKNQPRRHEENNSCNQDFVSDREAQIGKLNHKAKLSSAVKEDGYTKQNLKPGDKVLRLFNGRPTKLHPKWDGPFTIETANSNGSFRLKAANGHVLKSTVNGDRLKLYYSNRDTLYFKNNVKNATGKFANRNYASRQQRQRQRQS
jgi:IS30 family transposase